MFLIDKPYVSELLKGCILESGEPVVLTPQAKEFSLLPGTRTISEEDAIKKLRQNPLAPVYTSSENALAWVAEHLNFSRLPKQVALFKDKVAFRRGMKPFFEDFFFLEVEFQNLASVDTLSLPFPVILKPAVGFFSLGVYRINSAEEWAPTVESLSEEWSRVGDMYPAAVLDATSFIIEECLSGDEYAIDAYFDSKGEPVILNVTHHLFSSEEDMGDRVYVTSKKIIESLVPPALDFLQQVGQMESFRHFPLHFEVRMTPERGLVPIEVNPLRFGAWCTTGDMAKLAWGFNPFMLFFKEEKPYWEKAFAGVEETTFSMVLLNNSTGIPMEKITSFNHELLKSKFEKILEYRKIEMKAYPLFGFAFTETSPQRMFELTDILHSDLTEFVTVN